MELNISHDLLKEFKALIYNAGGSVVKISNTMVTQFL